MDSAAKANPDVYWWIKGDGCDVVGGLGESVSGVWSGDVDLNTGDLQRSYDVYKSKLALILGIGSRRSRTTIREDLDNIYSQLISDKDFIIEGNNVYTMYVYLYM